MRARAGWGTKLGGARGARRTCSAAGPAEARPAFPGGLDPSSPAGRLASLEGTAASPEDAVVFRTAANTVRVLCEARLQQATAMAVLGLAASLTEAGVQGAVAKSGYAVTRSASGETLAAIAHMWVEVEGRVVDVCYNSTYVFEDARRAGLDLDQEDNVRTRVGPRMTALLDGILSGKRGVRLAVLDQAVDVGPDAWTGDSSSSATVELASELPSDADGLDEAKSMRRAFEDIISNEEVNKFWLDGMPPEYRRIYAALGGPAF